MTTEKPKSRTTPGLVAGVLWSWLGLLVSLTSGLVLTPILLRKFGASAYGLWAIAYASAEAAWLFDLGIRSATGHYVARARATGNTEQLSQVLNTSIFFFGSINILVVSIALFGAQEALQFYRVPHDMATLFEWLFAMAVAGWMSSAVFGVFEAYLEGTGRFDVLARIGVSAGTIRIVAAIAAATLGNSLIGVGAVTMVCQVGAGIAAYRAAVGLVPDFRISFRAVTLAQLKQLIGYGGPALAVSLSSRLMANAGSMVIGHYFPPNQVAYYAVPWRLTQLLLEPCYRIGAVVRARIAALAATGSDRISDIFEVVRKASGLSLILVLAGVCFLMPFSHQLLEIWSTPAIASHSAAILRVMLAASALGIGAQFCSGTALFGMGTHKLYSVAVVLESLSAVSAMAFIAPRAGPLGVAIVGALATILFRGIVASSIFCRQMKRSWVSYCKSIYLRPLLAAALVLAVAYSLPATPGPHGALLILVYCGGCATCYVVMAFYLCLPLGDREALIASVSRFASRRRN